MACGVVFPDILLGDVPVTVDCSSLASRCSLFVVILFLLSSPGGFESPALLSSVFFPSIATSSSSLLVGWTTPCASSGPVLSSRNSCRCPVQSLWRCWVVCLMRMILHARPRSVVSIPALCSVQSSFGIPTRDDGCHWPSASHSRILGCVPLHCVRQCAIGSFVSCSQSCGSH